MIRDADPGAVCRVSTQRRAISLPRLRCSTPPTSSHKFQSAILLSPSQNVVYVTQALPCSAASILVRRRCGSRPTMSRLSRTTHFQRDDQLLGGVPNHPTRAAPMRTVHFKAPNRRPRPVSWMSSLVWAVSIKDNSFRYAVGRDQPCRRTISGAMTSGAGYAPGAHADAIRSARF